MNIRKIIKEEMESKWRQSDYDYQWGFCHYFAYNVIDKLKEMYPNKDIKYYLLLADLVYDFDEGEVEQEYLIHAYISIDGRLLDSNGFTTEEEAERRLDEWEEREYQNLRSDYRLDTYIEESDEIPKIFFNRVCDKNIVKKDINKFLSHPDVKNLLSIYKHGH